MVNFLFVLKNHYVIKPNPISLNVITFHLYIYQTYTEDKTKRRRKNKLQQ